MSNMSPVWTRVITRDRLTLVLIACVTLPYYSFLMTRGVGTLFMPTGAGLTFNCMLAHLLHGQFDVDPQVIGAEGFAFNGKIYAYFGIVPALLRLPLMPVLDLRSVDVTGLMCVLAVWSGGLFQAASVLVIRRATPPTPTQSLGVIALLATIVLGGAQVPFLRPSIYQESCSWAVAFASMFIYWALRGLIEERSFTRTLLTRMATAAGLALMTRVTTGLGLYLAFGALMLARSWHDATLAGRPWLAMTRSLLPRDVLLPLCVLGVFVIITGFVNTMRWGSPEIYMPLPLQLANEVFPDRTIRFAQDGAFNVRRLLFGVGYYFFPIWSVVTAGGHFIFGSFQERMFDAVELPPSSFLLSDPLFVVLLATFLVKQRVIGSMRLPAMSMLAGFSIPAGLMLVAISMAFRYRGEFYPMLLLGGFLGFAVLCRQAPQDIIKPIWRATFLIGALLGITIGQVTLICHRLTDFGAATLLLREGRLGAGPLTYYWSALGF